MSVTRNHRTVNDTHAQSSLLTVPSAPTVKGESVVTDEPLDYSVKTPSDASSPCQSKEAKKESHLNQTEMHISCSSSSTVSSHNFDPAESRVIARSSRRKHPGGDTHRRNLSAKSGLVVVNDCASLPWQIAPVSASDNPSVAPHNMVACSLSLSSASASNGSFSPSSGRDETSKSVAEAPKSRSVPESTMSTCAEEDEEGERIKVRTANGVVNRRRPRAMPDEKKDDSYWERRRKNNEAAKRSRDARRQKEDDVAYACRQLEMENQRLRDEIAELRTVIEQLRAEVLARDRAQRQQSAENSENCDPVIEQQPLDSVNRSDNAMSDSESQNEATFRTDPSGGDDGGESSSE